MKTMIMDTSSKLLILSFLEEDKIIYQELITGKNNHSDNLLKSIEAGLTKLQLQVKDFNRFIVGIGPGAYTGLRVSLAVAKMFAWTLNLPLYTISSLDLVATGLNTDGIYSVAMHAKRDYVYHKIIEIKNGVRKNITPEKFLTINEADSINQKYKVSTVINQDNINYLPTNISDEMLTYVNDLFLLEPNYLREAE